MDFATSPEADNLIYTKGPFSQYEQEYQDLKDSDPNLEDCPESHPYFEKTIKKCIKCPETHPYFNLISSKCQDCGSN